MDQNVVEVEITEVPFMERLKKETKQERVRIEEQLKRVVTFERTINPTTRPRKKREQVAVA